MLPSDRVRLRHMMAAANEAVGFLGNRTVNDLRHERVLSLALVRCIEIIGEAASKVTTETRDAFPELPWSDIIGMRTA
jgi:uncharacterized protein with HEPN domain